MFLYYIENHCPNRVIDRVFHHLCASILGLATPRTQKGDIFFSYNSMGGEILEKSITFIADLQDLDLDKLLSEKSNGPTYTVQGKVLKDRYYNSTNKYAEIVFEKIDNAFYLNHIALIV